MYRTFEELISKKLSGQYSRRAAAVAGSQDEHVLEAVFLAQEKGYIRPVLVGDEKKTQEIIRRLGYEDREYELIGCGPGENPSERATRLVHEKRADFIIKGKIETKDLLRPILNKETGLNSRGFIFHFGCMQLEGYDRLLMISDCAVIPYPTLEDKRRIIEVGVESLKRLGYDKPVVGVLCAVETVSPKMPETLDAQALREMSERGELDAAVLGPVSFDLATSREAAAIKEYREAHAGEVDFLVVPNLVTGNVMSKIWNADPRNILAGCLLGADIPIVLTSRSASAKEKLHSILLCALLSL